MYTDICQCYILSLHNMLLSASKSLVLPLSGMTLDSTSSRPISVMACQVLYRIWASELEITSLLVLQAYTCETWADGSQVCIFDRW